MSVVSDMPTVTSKCALLFVMPRPSPPTSREIAALFAALAQDTRLEAYRLLLRYHPFGLAAGDISRLLSVPHNTLSTHLRALEAAGLVRSRRAGRSVIFVADPSRFAVAAAFLGLRPEGAARHGSAAEPLAYPAKRPAAAAGPTSGCRNVLFLCSGNAARSLIAEAILSREGGGRFRAFSAGSTPADAASAAAIRYLAHLGYDTAGLHPKSWAEFATPLAPVMDVIVTLCDRAAGEACPAWPGHPLSVHWGIPGIGEMARTPAETEAALADTYRRLVHRVTALVNVPFERLSEPELRDRLAAIGALEGATEEALAGPGSVALRD